MGLSASQAKLLSITARLSDNELRTQTITSAKMSLSSQTSAASKAYINALNETELIYSTYDINGNKTYVDLTGAQLSTYAPLKNQYGLINNEGQILVSELDAENYKNSANIVEFLEKYGFENAFTETITTIDKEGYLEASEEYEKELEEWEAKEPDPTDPIYEIPGSSTTDYDLYDSFLWATAACYAGAIGALRGYMAEVEGTEFPDETIYDSKGNKVVEIYLDHKQGSTYHYYGKIYDDGLGNGNVPPPEDTEHHFDCYTHVFSHLLNAGDYTTSHGESITIIDGVVHPEFGVSDSYTHWWKQDSQRFPELDTNNRYERSQELAAILSEDAETVLYACGETGADITPESSDAEKLLSDYYIDENGEKKLKTLQQKIVDLNYLSTEGNLGYPEGYPNAVSYRQLYDAILHFVNHDLKKVLQNSGTEFDQEAYDKDYEEWLSQRPTAPSEGDYTYTETIVNIDQESEEGQWYINLWHRMNGASIYKTTIDGFDNGIHDEENDGVIEGDNITSPGNGLTEDGKPLWDILEDGLMNSSDWLKYALETGTITLERVNYSNPTEMNTGLKHYEWSSIIYTNALDISEQTNEEAIAKAEAIYESTTKDIEAKDKQYDNMLKLLDTEHNALQTEYDSVKSIISKNLERTLKIYSA